jgi:hypothetical protein
MQERAGRLHIKRVWVSKDYGRVFVAGIVLSPSLTASRPESGTAFACG